MRTASAKRPVALEPPAALRLWVDVRRWPTFVEGFARALRLDREWPEPGAKIEWESIPSGRGRVTEIVEEHDPEGKLATRVFDEQLTGVQTMAFGIDDETGETVGILSLEYELQRFEGAIGAITDRLFIRRALRDSLTRTLRRFSVEAEEEAALG
jgi:Polyketide cyclase / dehydrase and lipid transport